MWTLDYMVAQRRERKIDKERDREREGAGKRKERGGMEMVKVEVLLCRRKKSFLYSVALAFLPPLCQHLSAET